MSRIVAALTERLPGLEPAKEAPSEARESPVTSSGETDTATNGLPTAAGAATAPLVAASVLLRFVRKYVTRACLVNRPGFC
jgi:hypothetical protein